MVFCCCVVLYRFVWNWSCKNIEKRKALLKIIRGRQKWTDKWLTCFAYTLIAASARWPRLKAPHFFCSPPTPLTRFATLTFLATDASYFFWVCLCPRSLGGRTFFCLEKWKFLGAPKEEQRSKRDYINILMLWARSDMTLRTGGQWKVANENLTSVKLEALEIWNGGKWECEIEVFVFIYSYLYLAYIFIFILKYF